MTNSTVRANAHIAKDPNADLRDLIADILPMDSGMPLSTVIAEFETRAHSECIAPSRYRGRASTVVRGLLRELEQANRANRQTHSTTRGALEDPLWGGQHFKPYVVDLLKKRASDRASTVKHRTPTPTLDPDITLMCLRDELARVKRQLSRIEDQVGALTVREKKS